MTLCYACTVSSSIIRQTSGLAQQSLHAMGIVYLAYLIVREFLKRERAQN